MAEDGAGTFLTERQEQVLRLREEGHTQQDIGDRLGTTASNVSAVERAARTNVEKARRTLDLMRSIRAPASVHVEAGTDLDDLVGAIYGAGDESGVRIDYSTPELYGHLYGELRDRLEDGRLTAAVEVGLTADGDVQLDR